MTAVAQPRQRRAYKRRTDAYPTDHRALEVRHLLAMGESPWQVAAILRMSPESLARWLHTEGHHDLASQIEVATSTKTVRASA